MLGSYDKWKFWFPANWSCRPKIKACEEREPSGALSALARMPMPALQNWMGVLPRDTTRPEPAQRACIDRYRRSTRHGKAAAIIFGFSAQPMTGARRIRGDCERPAARSFADR